MISTQPGNKLCSIFNVFNIRGHRKDQAIQHYPLLNVTISCWVIIYQKGIFDGVRHFYARLWVHHQSFNGSRGHQWPPCSYAPAAKQESVRHRRDSGCGGWELLNEISLHLAVLWCHTLRNHMGVPRWDIDGKCAHGLKIGYTIWMMKYTILNTINPI